MKWQELFAQAEAAAKASLLVDNPDEKERLVTEARLLMTRAEATKSAEDIIARTAVPVRNVPLPTEPDAVTEPVPAQDKLHPAVKAAYRLQFGEQGDEVKAILRDLHGDDYEAKRWNQKRYFNAYLRGVTRNEVPREGKAFLWTPETVKLALNEGQDIDYMKTVMIESQDTLGGYTVPEDWRAGVISRLPGLTIMRPGANVIQTSRDSVSFPVATGGGSQYPTAITPTWVDETPAAATADDNLTWGQQKIPIHTQMIKARLSRSLVEDSAFNLASYLARVFAEAAAIDEDNQFLTGDGAGRPQGILPSSGNGLSITEDVTGNADTLTWDGLKSAMWGIDAQYRQNACWIAEKATYEVIDKLKDGNGEYFWRNKDQQQGTPPRLHGYPCLEQEAMPTVAASAYPIIFGDRRGYTIADRVGMSIERYLDSATAELDQVLFLMRRRLGGQVTETWRFVVQKVSAS